MRLILLVILVTLSASLHADAYKCKDEKGNVTFTSTPCPDDSRQVSSASSGSANPADHNRAQSNLEKQKAWLRNREAEQAREAQNFTQPAQEYVHSTEKLHSCLMAVTATPRLPAYTAGSRRVDCYRGTRGLTGECEASVAGTPGLTMWEEAHLQALCRNR